jgi:hypothetical protein
MPEQSNTHALHYQTPLPCPPEKGKKKKTTQRRGGGATYYVEILILYRTPLAPHNRYHMWMKASPYAFISFVAILSRVWEGIFVVS